MKFTFWSSLYCSDSACMESATLATLGFAYATWNVAWCSGTCGRYLPTRPAFATPPSVTVAWSYTYAPETRQNDPMRYSTSVCTPRTCVCPRFCFCAVVALSVTLRTGLLTRLSKHVSPAEGDHELRDRREDVLDVRARDLLRAAGDALDRQRRDDRHRRHDHLRRRRDVRVLLAVAVDPAPVGAGAEDVRAAGGLGPDRGA